MRSGAGRGALSLIAAAAACAATCGDTEPCGLTGPGAPWLAFSSRRAGSYDIWIERADGSCLRQVTTDPGDDLFATWAPQRKLAFTTDSGGSPHIRIHDFADGTERTLDVGALYATSPAFSPDGAQLAFEGRVPGQAAANIHLVGLAGGTPQQLTDDPGANAGPAWSADGKTVYFVSNRSKAYEVWSVKPAECTAQPPVCPATQVTAGSRIVGKPTVSPDGRLLAFARTAPGSSDSEVVTYELATGAVAVVPGEGDSEPSFHPSGRQLAVRSYRHGNPELALVDLASGVELVRLTDDPSPDGAPSFAPVLAGVER